MRSVLCVKPAFDWMNALLFVKKKRLLARCKRFEFALPVPQVISAVVTFCVRILDLGRNHFCNFSRSLRKCRICGGTDALRKNWFPSLKTCFFAFMGARNGFFGLGAHTPASPTVVWPKASSGRNTPIMNGYVAGFSPFLLKSPQRHPVAVSVSL